MSDTTQNTSASGALDSLKANLNSKSTEDEKVAST